MYHLDFMQTNQTLYTYFKNGGFIYSYFYNYEFMFWLIEIDFTSKDLEVSLMFFKLNSCLILLELLNSSPFFNFAVGKQAAFTSKRPHPTI